jgi:hypothetical protein
LSVFERVKYAGEIHVAKAGDEWVAWAEPSADFTGKGGSPLAAMKALVERITLGKNEGPNG